ncbi:hypothetical protein HKX48_000333, partial [Thoreauomyces humboldtii]
MVRSTWSKTTGCEWIGQPLTKTVDDLVQPTAAPTPTRRTTRSLKAAGFDNMAHYIGFRKDGIDYRLNDCALLEAEDRDTPYKAKIIACYCDEKGQGMIKVRWLYSAEDAKKGRKKVQVTIDPNEIFYSNEKDRTEAENVCGRMTVLTSDDFKSRYPDEPPSVHDGDPVYFCRRMWDDKHGQMGVPVTWADFESNVDVMETRDDPPDPFSSRKRGASLPASEASQPRKRAKTTETSLTRKLAMARQAAIEEDSARDDTSDDDGRVDDE